MRVYASNETLGYRIEGDIRMELDTKSSPGVVIGHIPALGLVVEAQSDQEAYVKLHQVFADFCEIASERQGKSILDALVARGCSIESGDQATGDSPGAQYLKIFLRRADAQHVAKPRAIAVIPNEQHLAAIK